MFSRSKSSSYRSPLGAPNTTAVVPPDAFDCQLKCQCGQIVHSVHVHTPSASLPLRCHCRQCRRFHASAFAALLPIQQSSLPPLGDDTMGSYTSACDGVGCALRRFFCARCKTILCAIPESSDRSTCYVAMGSIEDESIPRVVAQAWQVCFEDRAHGQAAAWWKAAPASRGARGSTCVLHGGCACGACRFEAPTDDLFQTQHCYCNLCRRLSGSVAQTWIPVRPRTFLWTSQAPLRLVRTTPHGQRHVCDACGTTMTIVYDSQPDCIWPVAGVCDDETMPADLSAALCRAIHICCEWQQPWYSLPDDGLPRLRYAG